MIGFAAVVLVTACAHRPAVCAPPPPIGMWTLRSIDGAPVPLIVHQSGAYKLEMLSVTMNLGTDGRFNITSTTRESMTGHMSEEIAPDSGTYVLAGPNVTLRFLSDGKTTTALLDCQALTMKERGSAYVFSR